MDNRPGARIVSTNAGRCGPLHAIILILIQVNTRLILPCSESNIYVKALLEQRSSQTGETGTGIIIYRAASVPAPPFSAQPAGSHNCSFCMR